MNDDPAVPFNGQIKFINYVCTYNPLKSANENVLDYLTTQWIIFREVMIANGDIFNSIDRLIEAY